MGFTEVAAQTLSHVFSIVGSTGFFGTFLHRDLAQKCYQLLKVLMQV